MRLMPKLAATAVAVAGAGAALLFAGSASAAVTFDPETGSGFVGKGDVQLAFGWNNTALQNNAAGVKFSSAESTTYSAVCTWVTGEGKKGEKIHTVTLNRTATVDSEVTHDARRQNQITGFTLNGFGDTVSTGTAPVLGGSCLGEGTAGEWTSVEASSSPTVLSVSHGGTTVPLS